MMSTSKEDVRSPLFAIIKTLKLIVPVDYNSWQESEQGLALAASLDKDVILAEGKLNRTTVCIHHTC